MNLYRLREMTAVLLIVVGGAALIRLAAELVRVVTR